MAKITHLSAVSTKQIFRLPLLFLMLLLSLTAQADFVTDKIVIEVRSQRLSQGAVLTTLPSGSAVEVLMADGDYSRIRTSDNVTGWVQSQFLTKERPTQVAYLELLAKSKTLEDKLKATEMDGGGDGIDISEIEELRKRAADAGWMRVELKKVRDQNLELENKLKTSDQPTNTSQKEIIELNNKNKELERRLTAAIQFNEQQQEIATDGGTTSSESATQNSDQQGWAVTIEWFLGSIVVALIVGLIGGMTWLDKRIRQRHGGFRIY